MSSGGVATKTVGYRLVKDGKGILTYTGEQVHLYPNADTPTVFATLTDLLVAVSKTAPLCCAPVLEDATIERIVETTTTETKREYQAL